MYVFTPKNIYLQEFIFDFDKSLKIITLIHHVFLQARMHLHFQLLPGEKQKRCSTCWNDINLRITSLFKLEGLSFAEIQCSFIIIHYHWKATGLIKFPNSLLLNMRIPRDADGN